MTQRQNDEELPDLQGEQKKSFLEIVKNPQKNFFIQGQAGTGKSTLIKHLKKTYEENGKKVALVAPTGIAAELIGGSTIHSLFWLGGDHFFKKNLEDINPVLRKLSILIIDEISMVRADILDVIDYLCRKAKNINAVFGGIQIVLVGDLHQIAPIVEEDAENDNVNKYGVAHPFFFDARCYGNGNFKMITLNRIYRQSSDAIFLKNLQSICSANELSVEKALDSLNERVISAPEEDDIPTVTTTRKAAKEKNDKKLEELEGEEVKFQGVVEGKFDPDKDSLSPIDLRLKVGAKVMFSRNDTQNGQYVNGTMGIVTELHNDLRRQSIIVKTQRGETVVLKERATWEKHRYSEKAGELKLDLVGSFKQFPLMLAYAITIHKSQGQTWDKVNIELGRGSAFSHGLIYVALSRVKTQEGIYLNRRLNSDDVILDPRVRQFLEKGERPPVEARKTEHTDSIRREDSDCLKEFWRKELHLGSGIAMHLASFWDELCETTRSEVNQPRCMTNCFWFTLRYFSIQREIILICSDKDNKTSWVFKIPPNSFTRKDVSLNTRLPSRDGRRDPLRRRWCRENKFDLIIEKSEQYCELNEFKLRFKDYLVASETRGVVTLYNQNDDLS